MESSGLVAREGDSFSSLGNLPASRSTAARAGEMRVTFIPQVRVLLPAPPPGTPPLTDLSSGPVNAGVGPEAEGYRPTDVPDQSVSRAVAARLSRLGSYAFGGAAISMSDGSPTAPPCEAGVRPSRRSLSD